MYESLHPLELEHDDLAKLKTFCLQFDISHNFHLYEDHIYPLHKKQVSNSSCKLYSEMLNSVQYMYTHFNICHVDTFAFPIFLRQ